MYNISSSQINLTSLNLISASSRWAFNDNELFSLDRWFVIYVTLLMLNPFVRVCWGLLQLQTSSAVIIDSALVWFHRLYKRPLFQHRHCSLVQDEQLFLYLLVRQLYNWMYGIRTSFFGLRNALELFFEGLSLVKLRGAVARAFPDKTCNLVIAALDGLRKVFSDELNALFSDILKWYENLYETLLSSFRKNLNNSNILYSLLCNSQINFSD